VSYKKLLNKKGIEGSREGILKRGKIKKGKKKGEKCNKN